MSLEYNLQFFAAEGQGGEKTEPATEKKLTDARKEGQVAKSREVANGLGLLAVFLVLKLWVGNMGYQFMNVFTVIYEKIPEVVTFWHGNMPQQDTTLVFRKMMLEAVVIMAPLLLIGFLIAFLSDVVQVGWHPTGKTLQPKFSKMSPVSGFKRIFSVNSVVELIKSLLKIGLIVYICYNYLKNKWPLLYQLYDLDLMQAIGLIGNTVTDLGIRISLIYMIIAAADFIYQKVKFSRDMRMTKQEVKEEYKQQEGDPQIKGRIRQRMREALRDTDCAGCGLWQLPYLFPCLSGYLPYHSGSLPQADGIYPQQLLSRPDIVFPGADDPSPVRCLTHLHCHRRIHTFPRKPFLIEFYEKLAFSHDLIGQDIAAVIGAMKFFFILTDIQ